MRRFRWLSAGGPGWSLDLRRCGWRLAEDAEPCPALAEARDWAALCTLSWRDSILLLDAPDGEERARLLERGFGEVLAPGLPLAELSARASRIAARLADPAEAPERLRKCGPLTLDLVRRDALLGEAGLGEVALGLSPREFALLWRLAATPGTAVGKPALFRDVWRLRHMPETNSIAVHVFRLRAKLALAGLGGALRTVDSSYLLDLPGLPCPYAAVTVTADSALDC